MQRPFLKGSRRVWEEAEGGAQERGRDGGVVRYVYLEGFI